MRLLAVDTETELWPCLGTDKVNCAVPCPPLVCITYACADGQVGIYPHHRTHDFHDDWLYEEDVLIVMHNATFDMGVLSKADAMVGHRLQEFVRAGRVLDTKVMYFLRYPDPANRISTLQFLAKKYAGMDLSKGAVRTSFRRDVPLTPDQEHYAVQDAVATLRVAEALRAIPYGGLRQGRGPQHIIAARHLEGLEAPDVVYSRAAAHLAWNLGPVGIGIDKAALEVAHSELSEKVEAAEARLLEIGAGRLVKEQGGEVRDEPRQPVLVDPQGFLLNQAVARKWEPCAATRRMWRAWKGTVQSAPARFKVEQNLLRADAEEFEAAREITIPRSRKTKSISLRRDDWRDHLHDPAVPERLVAYFEYQRWHKYRSAFTAPLVEAGADRVYPNVWIPGAATGRWACSKPNLQQVGKARFYEIPVQEVCKERRPLSDLDGRAPFVRVREVLGKREDRRGAQSEMGDGEGADPRRPLGVPHLRQPEVRADGAPISGDAEGQPRRYVAEGAQGGPSEAEPRGGELHSDDRPVPEGASGEVRRDERAGSERAEGKALGSLRSIYAPAEGCVFVAADYPTLELYTLAQAMYSMGISGPLRALLNEGTDLHTRVASWIFNVPEDEVTKEQRQGGKAASFGLPGGMGARRFAKHARSLGLEWGFEEAAEVRDKWLSHFHDVRSYLGRFKVSPWKFYRGPNTQEGRDDWLKRLGFSEQEIDEGPRAFDILRRINGGQVFTVVLPTGRTIPDRNYSMGTNCFFQAMGADIITRAFNNVSETGWRVCAVVHDSILLEVPAAAAPQARKDLADAMQRALKEVCPDVRTPEIETEVLERWE